LARVGRDARSRALKHAHSVVMAGFIPVIPRRQVLSS
jgi:hypothetical protein